jgi:hypothetical protein
MAEEESGAVAARPSLGTRIRQFFRPLRRRLGGFFGVTQPAITGESLEHSTARVLAARRRALAASGHHGMKAVPRGSMGLALSGGGIRSATISLGVAQSLAKHGRLLDFDYLSTVSGGGYFGSFLTTLFVPDGVRGPGGHSDATPDPAELAMKRRFALDALRADARAVDLPDPANPASQIRNPVWWLREHGRYLAPNGPTDYAMAATYMVRAWLAMIYVFLLPVTVFFVATTAASAWAFVRFPWLEDLLWFPPDPVKPATPCACATCGCPVAPAEAALGFHLSLLFVPAAVLMFLGVAAGIAFWFTETWPLTAARRSWRGWWQRWMPKLETAASMALTGIFTAVFLWRMKVGIAALFDPAAPVFDRCIAFGALLLLTAIATAAAVGLWCVRRTGTSFTTDIRRWLTVWGSTVNLLLLVALGAAVVDTLALNLYGHMRVVAAAHPWTTAFTTLVAPAAAWLINKLPGLFGGKDSPVSRFIGRHVGAVALVVAVLLYGGLGVLADTAVQFVAWGGGPLRPEPNEMFALTHLGWTGLIALIGMIVTGVGTGFINLSSLHNLYAARLTRAYLGGSNFDRLRAAGQGGKTRVQENDPRDDIDAAAYQRQPSAAPIHLINVTLNETRNREGSQLVERDRKGVPAVFAPEGVLIDAARAAARRTPGHDYFYPWSDLAEQRVEALSVGQLCAISGAAASTGMGAKTTLGGALALTFANIRLGYWWSVGKLIRRTVSITESPRHWLYIKLTRPLRTYFYLFNEMTARYSRDYGRLNISDGGHFDNSGAYELLRRGVHTILVCDNGADPHFAFEDMENLIRKARIDQGLSINVANPKFVVSKFGVDGKKLFLNGGDKHWRDRAKNRAPDDAAFALLLVAYERSSDPLTPKHIILWLKPRLFAGLTQDVIGYSLAHGTFPHESTANQFFDEEQWESYRALGYSMMEGLFAQTYYKDDCLRVLGR